MSEQVEKTVMLDNLRGLLRDVFRLRREGTAHSRLARAHGYVDGYMRMLIESGVATRAELLALVAMERVRCDGPATSVVGVDDGAASGVAA